jgi:hypothetical protein
MEEHIKSIKALIEANKAMPRTHFLEVALGGLRTALGNSVEHVAALDRLAAAKPAPVASGGK